MTTLESTEQVGTPEQALWHIHEALLRRGAQMLPQLAGLPEHAGVGGRLWQDEDFWCLQSTIELIRIVLGCTRWVGSPGYQKSLVKVG